MKKNFIANNESGIILITVLMVVLVMMIFALGIMSTNTSQAVLSRSVEERIRSDELAKGAVWLNYSRLNQGLGVTNVTENIGGRNYTALMTYSQTGSGPYGTDTLSTAVSY